LHTKDYIIIMSEYDESCAFLYHNVHIIKKQFNDMRRLTNLNPDIMEYNLSYDNNYTICLKMKRCKWGASSESKISSLCDQYDNSNDSQYFMIIKHTFLENQRPDESDDDHAQLIINVFTINQFKKQIEKFIFMHELV